jgi:hypothetical protein
MLRPCSGAHDDPRDRGGGLRLESGKPDEDAPIVGAECHPGLLAGRQQQVRRAVAQGVVPASYARYTARTAGVARAWLSLSNGP